MTGQSNKYTRTGRVRYEIAVLRRAHSVGTVRTMTAIKPAPTHSVRSHPLSGKHSHVHVHSHVFLAPAHLGPAVLRACALDNKNEHRKPRRVTFSTSIHISTEHQIQVLTNFISMRSRFFLLACWAYCTSLFFFRCTFMRFSLSVVDFTLEIVVVTIRKKSAECQFHVKIDRCVTIFSIKLRIAPWSSLCWCTAGTAQELRYVRRVQCAGNYYFLARPMGVSYDVPSAVCRVSHNAHTHLFFFQMRV